MATVHHIVLLKFKAGREARAAQLFAALAVLQRHIPGIAHYSFGHNNSPEHLNQGFTHAFHMTFADAAGRDGYLVHPEHEKVKDAYLPDVENVLVLDYEEA